jgi:sugar phosphate permease
VQQKPLCDEHIWSKTIAIHDSAASKSIFGKFIRRKALWVLSIIWVFAASTSIGVYYITPLFLTKELYLNIGYANTIFGLSRLGGFVVAISSGFLVSRFSIRTIMVSILIISGASTAFVALAGVKFIGIALFLQASFIYGFFPAGLRYPLSAWPLRRLFKFSNWYSSAWCCSHTVEQPCISVERTSP